jgi:hypothetical protein
MNRPTRIALGDLRVDLEQRRLFLKDSPIAVRQRAIDVLIALVEAEGQIVSRDQLMADVWRGRSVQQSNLQVCVATLRKLFRNMPPERFTWSPNCAEATDLRYSTFTTCTHCDVQDRVAAQNRCRPPLAPR